ncbi:MAG TPA: hypothetical protein VK887_04360 [Pseudonocardiaceae bacterium]|nr:hypothetical protein [Pseudonocardiaceae bacterium]
MTPPAAQSHGGNPYVPTYRHEPSLAAGPTVVVSRDEVLAKHAALLAEADDFRKFLESIEDQLRMKPCGKDPVSLDVARAVTYRVVDGPDSYYNVCQQWVDNLYQTAKALAEVAKQYGYTDEEIATSLRGAVPGA